MATVEVEAVRTVENGELVAAGESIAREIETLQVIDDATFQRAGTLSRQLATWLKTAHEFFDPLCDSTYRAWKTATERRKSVIGPRETMKETLGERMAVYEQEQERRRQQAEEAARREQERLEAEENARVEAENARLKKEAEDRVLEDALAADASGDHAAADFLLDEPTFVPTVTPQPVFVAPVQVTAPKADGVSFRSDWSAQLTSLGELVKAAAGGNTVALSCLTFDQVRANQIARSLKGALQIPGVKAVEKRVTATRAR